MKSSIHFSNLIFKNSFQERISNYRSTPRRFKTFGELSASFARYFLAILVCITLLRCANQGFIEGGAKDTQPPRLDSLNSSPNFQTRFKKKTIELTYDEWVQLTDVFNQVIISPPLEFRPDIKLRKKTVEVQFDEREVLRENATYVLNFGKAIKDLTEGNVAPMVFVFSTGDFIDSLSVSGQIVDAYTGEAVGDALFLLYENQADSVLRTERPFYFARTEKDGRFRVDNVKPGTFKAAALLDKNLNYRFDNEAEKIAFLDSALLISQAGTQPAQLLDTLSLPDSVRNDSVKIPAKPLQAQVHMRLFEEEKQLFLRGKETATYGLVKLSFNSEPANVNVDFDSLGQEVFLEKDRDTIRLWYNLPTDTAWNVYIRRDTATDTVRVQSGLRAGFLTSTKLTAPSIRAGAPAKHLAEKPFGIGFSHPLASFDGSKIRLLEDTSKAIVQPFLSIDSVSKRNLLLTFPWKEGLPYEVQILPGGVMGIFGIANVDTLRRLFSIALKKDLGTLNFKVLDLRPDKAYVVRVLTKLDAPALETFLVNGSENFQKTLAGLLPSAYTIEIIEDLDGNGRWTTGNYDLRRQPERVLRKTLEPLRANWELDAEVEWSFRD